MPSCSAALPASRALARSRSSGWACTSPLGVNEKRGAGWAMRPGMYTQVRVPVRSQKGGIAVSAGAVKRKAGREYLFVVDRKAEDGPVARQVTVETGLRHEGYVQIVKGDVDGQSIVVSTPRDNLKDGDRVKLAGE